MKDWKKCTAFLLALVICLGLAACGVGSSEGEREDYLFVYAAESNFAVRGIKSKYPGGKSACYTRHPAGYLFFRI